MIDKVEMFEIVLMQGLVRQTHTKAHVKITPPPVNALHRCWKVSRLESASSLQTSASSFLAPNLSFLIKEGVLEEVAQTKGEMERPQGELIR